MPSGRPLYEPNPAAEAAGHRYDIERLKTRLTPPSTGVNPRIAFGRIDGNSGEPISPGSGDWTVETDFAGNWTVTFDPPFAEPPTVVPVENETTSAPPADVSLVDVAADYFTVQTFSGGELSNDIGFNFSAFGVEGSDDADS